MRSRFGLHPSLPPLAALLFAAVAALVVVLPISASGSGAKKPAPVERSQLLWDQGFDLPPGAHLRFAKVDETVAPDGHTLRYRIYADGAQPGAAYVLGLWRIGTPVDDLEVLSETAYVNHKGLLLGNLPNPAQLESDILTDGSELDVTVKVAKGEPVRFILHSQDWKTMIGGTLVPYPLESVNKNCKLAALIADPDANSALFYFDGLPPNTELAAQGSSNGTVQNQTIDTDAKGHASLIAQTHAKGVDTGTLTESIRTNACSVSVSVPFGMGSYHAL
jgi:hypothetical protein